jgi:hypothetical protein
MKKCPQCSRTYPDDTLAFCLEDGSLLSASYNPIETQQPTAAFNVAEVPTVIAAREIPTVVAPKEILTVVNQARPTQQAETLSVGWTFYLKGFVISLIFEALHTYLLYPAYLSATFESYQALANYFYDTGFGHVIAFYILSAPLNLFVYSLLAFVLGFVWSRGKWRWGIVALIPNFALTFYYFVISPPEGGLHPGYYIRVILLNIIYTIATCLFAHLGSRLSRKPTA